LISGRLEHVPLVGVVGAYLSPAVGRQLDAVVWDELVDVSVLVPF